MTVRARSHERAGGAEAADASSDPTATPRGWLPYHRLLGARLYAHTRIRWAAALAIVAAAAVGRAVMGVDVDLVAITVLGVGIAGYNAVARWLTHASSSPEETEASYGSLLGVMYTTIVLDDLALTGAVWMTGGVRSPFVVFFILHVVLSSVLLSRRAALVATGLAFALLAGLVAVEWSRLASPPQPLGCADTPVPLTTPHAVTTLLVYAVLFGVLAFLLTSLTDLLRRGERELHESNRQLDRLSRMRRDFLRLAMHDLRSPVAAIASLLNNLRDGLCGPLNDRQAEWIERCLARLDGLSQFLRDLQTLSTLETGELDQKMEPLDLPPLLAEVVEEQRAVAGDREHRLDLDVSGTLGPVRGHRRLLREAVANLVGNAVKYTPDGGHILVRGRSAGGVVRVEVRDDGPGIPAGEVDRLFDDFVRQRPSRGSGTGLGLSIVRRVADLHGGRVTVRTAPGSGSRFAIELPTEDVCLRLQGEHERRSTSPPTADRGQA